nr:unnamed protein product [Callosobruchus analis]
MSYAAVVYLRVGDSKGIVRTYLIAAKARVAPLKTLSLPRLELMGAVLLTDLVSFIQRAYEGLLFFDATYAWSDSRVTLCWLSASPHRWKTFVANRVAQVQSIVPSECWHYVPSAENPADCASRGLLPSQLLAHPLWWTGPPWLRLSNDNWPEQSPLNASSVGVDLEQKATVLTTYLAVSETDVVSYLLNRSSSLQKVKRVLAYILRFPKRARQNADRSYNPLSEEELQQALYKIVQHVQQECFIYLVAYLRFNPIENVQTGSTNSIARMNFVWTRERSKRSNTTRVRTVERWVPVSKKNIFLRFSIFSVLRQLTRSHKTTRRILQEAGLLSTR